MAADEISNSEILDYLKTHMMTKAELGERFAEIEKRLEEIDARVQGAHNRMDEVYVKVTPVEQLVPLIENDFYKRFLDVEQKVKGM